MLQTSFNKHRENRMDSLGHGSIVATKYKLLAVGTWFINWTPVQPRIRGGSRLHPIEANGGLRIMSKNGSPTANMMILLVDVLRYACLREFFGPGGHLLSTHCRFNFT